MLWQRLGRLYGGQPGFVPHLKRFSDRRFTTQIEVKNQPDELKSTFELKNAKPFEEMPGPSGFEFLRGFLPGGKFHNKSILDAMQVFQNKYGSTFRFPGIFGNPSFVVSMDPADFATVFRNEGQWPDRRSFDSAAYYRNVHRKDFFQDVEGVLFSSGETWGKSRTKVNPVLMQPKNAKLYINNILEVNDEFLNRIRECRDPNTFEVPDTFEDDINRLTFDTVAAVALNTNLGLLRKNRDSEESKALLSSLRRFFDLATDLDVMPSIWKYVKTPKFWELMRTMDTMTNTCAKYIDEAIVRIEQDADDKLSSDVGKEKSVLEKLLKIDKKLAVIMALDMLFAGVDTTSSTLAGIFICIATNPDKQQKLFEEIKQILPEKDSQLTIENMRSMPYLRACIKESMRMYPLLPGTMRRMPHEVVIGGYRVPKGMEISVGSNVQLRNEKYVTRPNEFLPERWIRSDSGRNEGAIENPFLFLPFGFGPRMCVGKRIVELELEITLARLVRNFQMSFNYSVENAFKSKLINVPAIPLKFKFEERTS